MADVVGQKRLWLNKRGLHSEPLASSWLEDFIVHLNSRKDGRLKVVASMTTAGGRPYAYEIGLRYRDRHCCFIAAHDVSTTDGSPGRLHMDHAQCQAIRDGVRIFDLLVPLDPHKESWSSGHVRVHDYWLPLSLSGQIAGRFYLNLLRPLARSVYHKSSPRFRRALKTMIGR